MAKYLRINKFLDITPPDYTGHKYKLEFDTGDFKADNFITNKSHSAVIEISDILEINWGLGPVETRHTVGSICISHVLEHAKNNELELLKPVVLNTFNSGKVPPSDLYISTEGSILSFAEKQKDEDTTLGKTEISFLSDDISEIRDHINTYAIKMLGKKLLLINQERALFDMYKSADSDTEFVSRIASITELIKSINKKIIGAKLELQNTNEFGQLILLEKILTFYSDEGKARDICIVFKMINELRKGYPIHSDNIKGILTAHDYFALPYPIANYKNAWETILNCYFESMKKFREVFIDFYNNNCKE